MERMIYHPFSLHEENREGFVLKQEEYEQRLKKYRRRIGEILATLSSSAKVNVIPPNKSYVFAFYKSKIIEWLLAEGQITYPFALREIKRLKIYYDERWFMQAYKTIEDYSNGTLKLPLKT